MLAVATLLFQREGFSQVGVDRIAEESGISKMTLYKYFGSRDELVKQLLLQHHHKIKESIETQISGVDDPLQKLKAIYNWHVEWIRSEGFYGCLFIKAAEEYMAIKPDIVAAVRIHKCWLLETIEAILKTMEARPPESLAAMLTYHLDGMTVQARMMGALMPEHVTEDQWRLYLKLLEGSRVAAQSSSAVH